jgi:uncharacterized membrane protein YcaP (DUF421 family)
MLVILIRTVVLFLGIVAIMRILGKRQLGELEASELVITLLISELATVPIQDIGTPLLHGVIPILTIVGLELLITFGIIKSLRFRLLLCGKPSIVVQDGKIIQKELLRSRISVDELLEELRAKNVTDISQVKYAILETSGDLSVILYGRFRPVTVGDINIETPDTGLPIAVISDGKYLRENMKIRNVDPAQVEKFLKDKKMSGKRDIFLMTIDDLGNIYMSAKEKQP